MLHLWSFVNMYAFLFTYSFDIVVATTNFWLQLQVIELDIFQILQQLKFSVEMCLYLYLSIQKTQKYDMFYKSMLLMQRTSIDREFPCFNIIEHINMLIVLREDHGLFECTSNSTRISSLQEFKYFVTWYYFQEIINMLLFILEHNRLHYILNKWTSGPYLQERIQWFQFSMILLNKS